MGRLERFRGHFYNWYDTGDLRPLEPRYVSTVDSGNLAGHLLVLGNACASAIHRPLLDRRGVRRHRGRARCSSGTPRAPSRDGRSHPDGHARPARREPSRRWPPRFASPRRARRTGRPASGSSPSSPTTLVDIARTLTAERGDDEDADLLAWAEATRAAIASHERVVLTLMPWAPHLAAALSPFADAPPEAITAIGVLLSSSPGPAELADLGVAAARELADLRDARLRDTSGARGRHRARRRDHRGAHGGRRRVPGARRSARGRDHAREGDVRRDAVRLPLRSRRARSSRSATASRTAASIPAATTCSPPRRGSPASSRSPRATSPSRTGSTSAAP